MRWRSVNKGEAAAARRAGSRPGRAAALRYDGQPEGPALRDAARAIGGRCELSHTPQNITQTGESDWIGSDVTEEQELSVDHQPDKPGPFFAIIYLGKPSERVSINPKMVITSS